MTTFESQLKEKLFIDFYNNFGIENYDFERFGNYPQVKINLIKCKEYINNFLNNPDKIINKLTIPTLKYFAGLNFLYNELNDDDKKLLIELISFRILGFRKVKLSINNDVYNNAIKFAKSLSDITHTYNPKFKNVTLHKHDLKKIGYDSQIYFSSMGVAVDFIIEQYSYKKNNLNLIHAEKGDNVLDIGGCWGDTAIYFANKVGEKGHVYSFEFIPNNIVVHQYNSKINPNISNRITLVKQPVWEQSDIEVYFKDNGPGSFLSFKSFSNQNGFVKTISIDDFVEKNNIEKIDFIKMDIEGAEFSALKGAVKTINKFKPKLAIALYHSLDDFVTIPKLISDLELGYKFYLGHYTIHAEETILFAQI